MPQNRKGIQEKDPVQNHLEQQFQGLGSSEKTPDDLRKEVFSTLDTINLVGDFLDLFTLKFGSTEIELIDILGSDND